VTSAQQPNEGPPWHERLKAWRTRNKLTQDEARVVLGPIGRTYYSRLETGKRSPGKFLQQKFEQLEHESVHIVHDLVDQHRSMLVAEAGPSGYGRSKPPIIEGRRNFVRRVPLLGWAQAGEAVDFEAVVDWENFVSAEIDDPKAVAVRIRGDSMAPRYQAGDIAVLACSDAAKNDDIVIAKLRDEGIVFKKLQIVDPQRQLYRFISFNDQYAPLDRTADKIVWLYPVDSVIQKLRR
jgi:phage repressor protein C with HTH and peptisase S24 domain